MAGVEEMAGVSPRLVNASALLAFAWDRSDFTASDAIAATGLARSTVIALCEELVGRGWLAELPDSRVAGAQYRKGRPARRYTFRADSAVLVGVDAGQHTVTTRVTDLRARELSRESRELSDAWPPAPQMRLAAIDDSIAEALAAAGGAPEEVLCVAVGVPAPTDGAGASPAGGDGFWSLMNPGIAEHLRSRGWHTIVENDANLAALAEGSVGSARDVASYVTVLCGERLGAGFVIDGKLVRGGRGGAGELHILDLVEGVGSADGVGFLARMWAQEARAKHKIPPDSVLAGVPPERLGSELVLQHIATDTAASAIADRIAARLARICAVLGGLLDADRIIFAGGAADSLVPVLDRAKLQLPQLMHIEAPDVVASTLGHDVVSIGAVQRALAWAQQNVLTLVAGSATRPAQGR